MVSSRPLSALRIIASLFLAKPHDAWNHHACLSVIAGLSCLFNGRSVRDSEIQLGWLQLPKPTDLRYTASLHRVSLLNGIVFRLCPSLLRSLRYSCPCSFCTCRKFTLTLTCMIWPRLFCESNSIHQRNVINPKIRCSMCIIGRWRKSASVNANNVFCNIRRNRPSLMLHWGGSVTLVYCRIAGRGIYDVYYESRVWSRITSCRAWACHKLLQISASFWRHLWDAVLYVILLSVSLWIF